MLAIAALLAGAALASAHDFREDSRITNFRYNEDKERFQGDVRSDRQSCEKNRVVKVFRQKNAQDQLVGEDHTNRGGFWKVPAGEVHGDFYATVKRRVQNHDDDKHNCGGDRTGTIFVQ